MHLCKLNVARESVALLPPPPIHPTCLWIQLRLSRLERRVQAQHSHCWKHNSDSLVTVSKFSCCVRANQDCNLGSNASPEANRTSKSNSEDSERSSRPSAAEAHCPAPSSPPCVPSGPPGSLVTLPCSQQHQRHHRPPLQLPQGCSASSHHPCSRSSMKMCVASEAPLWVSEMVHPSHLHRVKEPRGGFRVGLRAEAARTPHPTESTKIIPHRNIC